MAGVDTYTAVILSENDDVATVFTDVEKGQNIRFQLSVSGKTAGNAYARQSIPSGHKIARWDIRTGSMIRKYGYPVGRAISDISRGDHVHVHNLQSLVRPSEPTGTLKPKIQPGPWVKQAVVSLAQAAGCPPRIAEDFADALTEAHLRGVETHGIRRLRPYLDRMRTGGVDPTASPVIEQNHVILRIDGRNGVGHHVAAEAADAAADTAKAYGASIALIRNSNHFGFAGYYATRMAARGNIGIVVSNGQVCVTPRGGKRAIFSNNPIAVAAPLAGSDTFMELDMATSVISRAKIAQAAERGETIAAGLSVDADGKDTQDPVAALAGSLLPFGGEKGFGFLCALEVLTGILPGGAFADQVSSKETHPDAPERLSHFIMAIDIEHAMDRTVYEQRIQELLNIIQTIPVEAQGQQPRYPGKRRWELRRQRLVDGIPLMSSEYEDLIKLMAEYRITMK